MTDGYSAEVTAAEVDTATVDRAHTSDALSKRFSIKSAEIKLLDAGSTPNYHVKADDGKQYLCKALRTRLGDWVADNASQITTLAAHLSKHGVPTPKPVPTSDGALVAVESGPRPDETTYFVVFEWAVGYTRADKYLAEAPAADEALMTQLGSILAKIHALPLPAGVELLQADAPGGHVLCDMGTWLENVADPSAWFKGDEDKDAVFYRTWLPKFAELFKTLPGPRKMIHGDCYLDNVLAMPTEGDGALSLSVVDFEDSCLAHPVADLAACAVGTCFVLTLDEESVDVKVELIRPRIAALVKGYEKECKLSEEDKGLLLPLMQACAWACGAFRYGRYREGVRDPKTNKYAQLNEVVEILESLKGEFNAFAFA